jgi:hypothetical protein
MSTPSLLNIPYLIKAGTLYSQIPETGLGDFVVTRVTSPTTNRSTRVNADGLLEFVNDNVPRLDYPVGGAVNGCASLLVEPAATNSNSNSNTFSVETAPVATVVQNQVDPFGNPNSAWLMSGADAGVDSPSGNNVRIIQSPLSSGIYTCSIYVKSPTGNPVTFRYRQTAGGDINGSTVVSGSGFQRIQLTNTNTVTSSRFIIYTTGGEPIIISCHQVEAGSVATSYIPTTTAAITRAADVIRKTSITSLIGQSEGTVYFEVEVTDEARNKWFCTLDSSATSFIQMWVNPTRQISAQINNSGTIVVSVLTSSVLAVGYHKVAFAYNTATNGCIMYVDGVQNPVATRTVGSPGLPAFNNMTFGGYIAQINESVKAHVRAGAVYPNRLSNSELATLTTP